MTTNYQTRPMSISSTTELIPPDLSQSEDSQFTNTDTISTLQESTDASTNMRLLRYVGSRGQQSIYDPTIPGRYIHTRNLDVGITLSVSPSSRYNNCATLPDLRHTRLPPYTPPVRSHSLPSSNFFLPNTYRRTNVQTQTSHSPNQAEIVKKPCIRCLSKVTSFKWLLLGLSLIGTCAIVCGVAFGSIHALYGNYLFLAIAFVVVGALLVIVVIIAWRCTPKGHEPCHLLFRLGHHYRQRRPRDIPTRSNGDAIWHGGILYPDVQYRHPPPSYAASVQDYHQCLQRAQQQYVSTIHGQSEAASRSPPPTYRSHITNSHPALQITFSAPDHLPNSRPPSYRSRSATLPTRPLLALPIYTGTQSSSCSTDNANMPESTPVLTTSSVQNETPTITNCTNEQLGQTVPDETSEVSNTIGQLSGIFQEMPNNLDYNIDYEIFNFGSQELLVNEGSDNS